MLRAPAVEDIPWESVHVAGNVRREVPTDNFCKTFDSLRPRGLSAVMVKLSPGQVAFRRSPSQSGYKWDNIFVYALRIGERPMGHPALRVIWSRGR
jgi:hypothetical protein